MENRWRLAECLSILFKPRCRAFGAKLDLRKNQTIQASKQFDQKTQTFVNRRREIVKEMSSLGNTFRIIKEVTFNRQKERIPKRPLPQMRPNLEEFLSPSKTLKYIWLGHSSFLMRIEGQTFLFDPVFHSAAPVDFMVKRFQPPVIALENMPEIDFIVLSHDHYDHLDDRTMLHFKESKAKFITPLAVGEHLRSWGIHADRIIELDWWQKYQQGPISFVCTPAQHFSGRRIFSRNKSLWCSWVILSTQHRVFFSGDSGYDIHFKEIGQTYGPFHLTFMENGQYNKLWQPVHMLPEESAQAHMDLRGEYLMPIHWGMFELSTHSWREPAQRIARSAKNLGLQLITPQIGELVDLKNPPQNHEWWITDQESLSDPT